MIFRAFTVAAAAAACCVSSQASRALALPPIETASLSAIAIDEMFQLEYASTFPEEFYVGETVEPQTLSAKVLAAIALERATGRKPDPTRFSGLN